MAKKRKQKFSKDTIFRFSSELMEALNIPNIELEEDREELWTYVHGDYGKLKKIGKEKRYMVSNYARIYDTKKKELRPIYESGLFISSVSKYRTVVLYLKDGDKYHGLLHRIVASSFLENPEEKPFVNHKDGNPSHNWLWNLEWCTQSENTLHAVNMGLKVDKLGENRSNAIWKDSEVHMVCKMMEEGHKATYIFHVLGDILKDPKVEYERVRSLYKHIKHQTHWRHISKLYKINFTRFNYSKEQSSVKEAEESNASSTVGGNKTSLTAGTSQENISTETISTQD